MFLTTNLVISDVYSIQSLLFVEQNINSSDTYLVESIVYVLTSY